MSVYRAPMGSESFCAWSYESRHIVDTRISLRDRALFIWARRYLLIAIKMKIRTFWTRELFSMMPLTRRALSYHRNESRRKTGMR